MRTNPCRRLATIALIVSMPAIVTGCGSVANPLPQAVTVTLPDGTTTQATLGAGVASLSDSTWQFFATTGEAQGLPFLTITFNEDGALERFDDNTLAPEVFGSTILFDGATHATSVPSVTYSAATYGAETSDSTGFTFEGRLNAFAAGLRVAGATASASGMFDETDPDVMTGTFEYDVQMEVDIPGVPVQEGTQSFGFIAHRAVE